jgi:hypothetical protein
MPEYFCGGTADNFMFCDPHRQLKGYWLDFHSDLEKDEIVY